MVMRIFIDGQENKEWTKAKLNRKKKDMTGSLKVDFFFPYIPARPVLIPVMRGKEILVYINDVVAFTGKIDSRNGKGKKSKESAEISSSFDDDSYSVSIECRGKTKYLIDSSHQNENTNIRNKSNKDVANEIIKGFDVEIDWSSKTIPIDNFVMRDGGRPFDELSKLCNENCHFMYETREGKLRIADESLDVIGESLVLGENILEFSSEQSEQSANSKIRVKGHKRKEYGEAAILDRMKEMKDKWVDSDIPLTVQHYGDATDEALERRGKWEADRRASQSKTVTIKLFDIAQRSGVPWDIGTLHYVEVPPEGIFDVMECIELTYTAEKEDVSTQIVLAPPPSKTVKNAKLYQGAQVNSLLKPNSNQINDLLMLGNQRRAASGVKFEKGRYPQTWTSADLSVINNPIAAIQEIVVNSLLKPSKNLVPPEKLVKKKQ